MPCQQHPIQYHWKIWIRVVGNRRAAHQQASIHHCHFQTYQAYPMYGSREQEHRHFPSNHQEVQIGLHDSWIYSENNLYRLCILIMQIRIEWARHHPVVLWHKFTRAFHWASNKIWQRESEMCTVNASKEDKMGTCLTNKRTGCFHSEDDQLNQKERRSTPGYVLKANSNLDEDGVSAIPTRFIHIQCQRWHNQQYR